MPKTISEIAFKAAQDAFLVLYERTVDAGTGNKLLLTRAETADRLSVSPGTVDKWRRTKKLKAVYPFGPNGEARYSPKSIVRLVKQLEIEQGD